MQNNGYYISSGALNGFYTLRQEQRDGNDWHVCTLARDIATAKAKAKGITGFDLGIDFDLDERRQPREVDWSIMQGGKFAGRPAAEVADENPDYIIFLFEHMRNSRGYEKTLDLLVDHPKISSRLARLEAERAEAARVGEARKTRVQQLIERIEETGFEIRIDTFIHSLITQLKHNPLSERQQPYLTEILAKHTGGRRGSKAYLAAVESWEAVLMDLDLFTPYSD